MARSHSTRQSPSRTIWAARSWSSASRTPRRRPAIGAQQPRERGTVSRDPAATTRSKRLDTPRRGPDRTGIGRPRGTSRCPGSVRSGDCSRPRDRHGSRHGFSRALSGHRGRAAQASPEGRCSVTRRRPQGWIHDAEDTLKEALSALRERLHSTAEPMSVSEIAKCIEILGKSSTTFRACVVQADEDLPRRRRAAPKPRAGD